MAINKFDSDDIKDARKMLTQRAMGLLTPEEYHAEHKASNSKLPFSVWIEERNSHLEEYWLYRKQSKKPLTFNDWLSVKNSQHV